MRLLIPVIAFVALCFVSAQAEAAMSCSSFATLKKYDPATKTLEVDYEKGKLSKFFPRPEGSPRDSQKTPKGCKSKVKKQTSLAVKPTGGRMSVTQVRSNYNGKMLNDTEDEAWVPGELTKLIEAETQVVIIVRPGMKKDDPLGITTIYLPVTDEELAEIKRIEDTAVED